MGRTKDLMRADVKSRGRDYIISQIDQEPNSLVSLGLDLIAAFAVMGKYIITFEALFVCMNTVLAVLAYHKWGELLEADLSWTLVSFAVVMPLTMSITAAFKRRDEALFAITTIRGLLCNILSAHTRWNWNSAKGFDGRAAPGCSWGCAIPEDHPEKVHTLLLRVTDAIQEYLMVPRGGRARHLYTPCGLKEARQVTWGEETCATVVTVLLGRLHGATEVLKKGGLPPNEASRINQYLFFLSREWERVRALKEYRTPQAMRSFSRVVIHVLPAFYGPYFLHISKGEDGKQDNIIFACVFACIFSVFMVGLLLVQTSMENPFGKRSLDTVRVELEMIRIRRALKMVFKDVVTPWDADDADMWQPKRFHMIDDDGDFFSTEPIEGEFISPAVSQSSPDDCKAEPSAHPPIPKV